MSLRYRFDMEIYHCYEMLTVWSIFINLTLMILIKGIVLKKKNISIKFIVMKNNLREVYSSLWFKIIFEIEILNCDKKSSLRWKSCIVRETHYHDKNLLWWASIHHCDENLSFMEKSLLWWTFIIIMMKFRQYDKNLYNDKKKFNWKIVLMKNHL